MGDPILFQFDCVLIKEQTHPEGGPWEARGEGTVRRPRGEVPKETAAHTLVSGSGLQNDRTLHGCC